MKLCFSIGWEWIIQTFILLHLVIKLKRKKEEKEKEKKKLMNLQMNTQVTLAYWCTRKTRKDVSNNASLRTDFCFEILTMKLRKKRRKKGKKNSKRKKVKQKRGGNTAHSSRSWVSNSLPWAQTNFASENPSTVTPERSRFCWKENPSKCLFPGQVKSEVALHRHGRRRRSSWGGNEPLLRSASVIGRRPREHLLRSYGTWVWDLEWLWISTLET